MNIWFIHHYANPPELPGDARHFSHARELIRRGHTVHIVACGFAHQNHKQVYTRQQGAWHTTMHEGVAFTWLPAGSYRGEGFRRIFNMFQFAWSAAGRRWARGLEKPDVVMGSSPHPFAALAAERIAAHYRVPFVLEIRDPWPYVLTAVGGHSPLHPFVILVDRTMRFLYRRAARIVMFSRHSAPLLVRLGAPREKIEWIPHGVDLEMFPAQGPAPDDGVFTLTYIGAHNQWNSLDTVLDAAKLLQDADGLRIEVQLVGAGNTKAGLVERARNENIRNVRFVDAVPKQQVHPILRSSDAFVLNNRVDALSRDWMSFNKLYEYLGAGRPVVFGSRSEHDPVRESGAGISVPAGDAPAMAEAIRALAALPAAELAEMGARGRRHIEEHYNLTALARRFETVLCEACQGNKAESGRGAAMARA
ncbi:MAG: glycosyltransferase family 4 protein [Terracidiphilus sp.]